MNAFITGSQAYGRPRLDSDVDLVVLVGHADFEDLVRLGDPDTRRRPAGTDSDPGTAGSAEHATASVRFGRLNLIVTTCPLAYAVWRKGTRELERKAEEDYNPVGRDEAVATFRRLRKQHGIGDAHG